jgi:hypothetical protein
MRRSRRHGVVVTMATMAVMAATLVTGPAAYAVQERKGGYTTCPSGYRALIQGRTTGDTFHSVDSTTWYKGYKNNVTSTTYASVAGPFNWEIAATDVATGTASCTIR